MKLHGSVKRGGIIVKTYTKSTCSHEEYASKAKGKILDLMKTMWSLVSLDTTVFFQLFDAQIKPMLLYASEIWGTARVSAIEAADLFACKRLLCVSNKTPNHMVYGDTGRYPLYIESTISSLRYWLKLRKMPMTRFPKQTLTMLENDIDIHASNSTGNWAGNIKHCLESYGFQYAWKAGVANETSFLSAFKRKMVERFQEEWHTKISNRPAQVAQWLTRRTVGRKVWGSNPIRVMWDFSGLTGSYPELGVLWAQWEGWNHTAELHPLHGCVFEGLALIT